MCPGLLSAEAVAERGSLQYSARLQAFAEPLAKACSIAFSLRPGVDGVPNMSYRSHGPLRCQTGNASSQGLSMLLRVGRHGSRQACSETRRKYVHVGLSPASLRATVSEQACLEP